MKRQHIIFILVVWTALSTCGFLFAADAAERDIDQWLVLGPARVPDIEKKLLGGDLDILNFKHLDISRLTPVEGGTVQWINHRVLNWKPLTHREFSAYETGVLYLAAYLEPRRWLNTELTVHNTNLGITVYLDGDVVKAQVHDDKITAPLELTNEKHLLVLKILLIKGAKFNFKASLKNREPFKNDEVVVSLTPEGRMKPEHVLNMVSVSNIRVSPNGRLVAVSVGRTEKESGKTRRSLEILDTRTGRTVFAGPRFVPMRHFRWLSNGRSFSYGVTSDKTTSIYRYDLDTHRQDEVIGDIKKFSSYWWAPDNSYLVYSTYKKEETNDQYKHIKEIRDRAVNAGYRNSMYLYFPAGKVTHRVGGDEQNFRSASISPDSRRVLFSTSKPDSGNRPYSKNEYHLLTLGGGSKGNAGENHLSLELILESHWVMWTRWAPDSRRLLAVGGPSSFDGLGNTLEKGRTPNDYDNQAFIYDPSTRQAIPITRRFEPSVRDASWGPSAGEIYFTATDREDVGLFKYSLKGGTYKRLDTKVDVVGAIDFAHRDKIAVYWGSGAASPHRLYKINLAGGKASLLKDYNKEYFKDVKIGTVRDWNFTAPGGKTIYGRIHYPPDFDKSRKYPCIVYYYGGVSPVTRDFGGRYPKNWYTANGYIVYVLQPSGAVGFGQDFSARHVNDWGKTTSAEIIAGVRRLITEHPYIDARRIGAMGASYGGFMTQYLAASTDLFAAFISHAGITSLASYWGVGDWGYSYSGIATADSFPWNRKDIYVGHSPLFMAERISRPLLLLHGDIDNNVPPGESYQMFAALKILGKDVELITFKGQRHWITEYKKRLHWMRTIIAWWDRHLKEQPEHWEQMYQ